MRWLCSFNINARLYVEPADTRKPVSQRWRRARTALAWFLLVGSMIGWPLSALTLARDEPQFVLGLSWLAITLTAMDLLTSSQVHEEQGEQQ